jgi:hypothetical protein
MISLPWLQLKALILENQLPYSWSRDDNSYVITAFNGLSELQCIIPTVIPVSPDQNDFETKFKSLGNQSTLSTPSTTNTYTAKTITAYGVTYNLYSRNTGIQTTVVNGANTITYVATYQWVKFLGIEIIGGGVGDFGSLIVYDSTSGTYTGVANFALGQFGYTLNIAPNFYTRQSPFDADLFVGMQLKFTYNSVSVLAKSIGLNLIMNEVKLAPPLTIINPVTGH